MSRRIAFINCALFGTDGYDCDISNNSNTNAHNKKEVDAVFCENGKISKIGSSEDILSYISELDEEEFVSETETKIIDGNDYLISSSEKKNNKSKPLLCPAFIDSHVHLLDGGARLTFVLDMSNISTKQEFCEAIRQHEKQLFGSNLDSASQHPHMEQEWMFGSGWDQEIIGEEPTKAWIDEVECKRPICLFRCDLHSVVVNSIGLEAAGITSENPAEVPGGVIERDPLKNHEPTGILRDKAVQYVREKFPKTSQVRLEQSLVAATKEMHRFGITSCHDMTTMDVHTNVHEFRFFERMFAEGKLKLRLRTSIRMWEIEEAVATGLCSPVITTSTSNSNDQEQGEQKEEGEKEEEKEEQKEEASRENNNNENDDDETTTKDQFLRLNFVKMFSDGSLGSRTARMAQPYSPRASECNVKHCQCGVFLNKYDNLLEGVINARKHGLLPCLHAIGDAAVSTAIDALINGKVEEVEQEQKEKEKQVSGRIEHCQHILQKDFLRLQQHRIVASVQPLHMASDAVVAEKVLGAWRRHGAFPLATMLRQYKVPLALGSDWPVVTCNAGCGMFAATTRRSHWIEVQKMSGVVPAEVPSATSQWEPRQCLTLRECLEGYTFKSAESSGDENLLGRIREGFAADFVLLSPDVSELLIASTSSSAASSLSDIPNCEILNEESIYLKTVLDGDVVFSVAE